jgi:hypothetical protein
MTGLPRSPYPILSLIRGGRKEKRGQKRPRRRFCCRIAFSAVNAVIAIFYTRFDHGMLIYHVPWSRAGPEVRPAFCV